MKVRIKTYTTSTLYGKLIPDTDIDVPKTTAERWIKHNIAEAADEAKRPGRRAAPDTSSEIGPLADIQETKDRKG